MGLDLDGIGGGGLLGLETRKGERQDCEEAGR
jgi:hypothetical protein